MHAVQDADLAGHPVHRQPHAVDREGHRTRRQVGPALGFEAVAGRGAGGMQVLQDNPLVAADHLPAFQAAIGGLPFC